MSKLPLIILLGLCCNILCLKYDKNVEKSWKAFSEIIQMKFEKMSFFSIGSCVSLMHGSIFNYVPEYKKLFAQSSLDSEMK